MLITYSLPTYDTDLMKDYADAYAPNIIKYNRDLLKIYSDINSGEVKPKDVQKIIKYGIEEGDYDPYNFTYFIACYFAKELQERFHIPYQTILNYSRLFAGALYYFVHYDEDQGTYDYLMNKLKFEGGYTHKAKELLDIYLREE